MIEKLKQINFPTSATFDNKKVAVVLTAFERPEFFVQTIGGLSKCSELEDIPIFLFVDGGKRSRQKDIIDIFKKLNFKNKYVVSRGSNHGANKNFFWALRDLFEELKFDYIGFLEEDCVVGKNYFKFCYDSFNKIKNKIDPNIGIFQGYSLCFMDAEEKKLNLDELKIAEDCHHWGMFFPKETYFSIKSALKGYFDIIDEMPLDGTASRAILERKIDICNVFDNIIQNSKFVVPQDTLNRYYRKQNIHCTLGWDGAFDMCLPCIGLKRYNSKVNRMHNVGRYGDCFGEQAFKMMKLDQIHLDEVW